MKRPLTVKCIVELFFILAPLFSHNMNLSNGYIFEGEPYIAIDPTNPSHLIVAWMSFSPFTRKVSIKLRTSYDGGETWGSIQTIPHIHESYTSADPSLTFDNEGNVYLTFIDHNRDSATGAVFLLRSFDGGLTWETPVEVISSNSDIQKPIDRPWISIDRSNGPNRGNVYVTTMPPRVFGYLPPPYHPYLSISTDGGNSFSWRYIDTTGWLAGDIIRQPMATLCVSSNGTLHIVYPSYVPSQDTLPRFIHAFSGDGGRSFSYNTVLRTSHFVDDTLVKKGYLILADPSNPEHLAFVYLSKPYGDIDVFLLESFDGGITWGEPIRVNDDPIGNNRMQDLIWADFDLDGDLVVTWRDRRNGEDSTYQTSYEIWGAVKWRDSKGFSRNFRISDTLIPYHPFLARGGNDFMCVKFLNDTIYAVWGDTRNGKLDIYFQKVAATGIMENSGFAPGNELISPTILVNHPQIIIRADNILGANLFDLNGRLLYSKIGSAMKLDHLPDGIYFIKIWSGDGIIMRKVINLH